QLYIMAKTYNLYFGKDAKPVEYYQPTTPKKELQDLIDNPDAWEQYLKDQADALKLVENERDALEAERNNLETERDQLKQDKEDLEDFLKNGLGYNNIAEAMTALAGQKLPDILTSADTTIKTLKTNEAKLKGDIAFLQNQNANMVDREDLKDAVEAKKKAINDLGNLQNIYTPLKDKTDGLNAKEKQKITDAKGAFERVVDRINKTKTVIIGDLTKKNIRLDLNRIKGILGYDDVNADIDSGE
ncbi:8471_t:CDS:2, partial [Racocetra persica]